MRRFYLDRQTDVSGTSGTGAVVEGVRFSDGSVVIHWLTALSSITFYRDIDDCLAIHGHDGATNLIWVDDWPSCVICVTRADQAEAALAECREMLAAAHSAIHSGEACGSMHEDIETALITHGEATK